MKRNKKMKIGIYVAHDDDSILGVGGKILQYLKDGNDVYIVIFTDGRSSHKSVLGIKTKPAAWEVKTKRKEEIIKAMNILGVAQKKLYFLNLIDGEGKVWQNEKQAYSQALKITMQEKPDIIYFHHLDAHRDHRAVNKVILKMLNNLEFKPKARQFFIWTKELAKNRSKVCDKDVLKISKDVLRVKINQRETDIKRRALYAIRSQVLNWPYEDWQVQEMPILDKSFINYFLRGEEIFIEVNY